MLLFVALLATSVYAQQAQLVNLKCADVKSAVDAHNWGRLQLARGKVPGQPAAANMKIMKWDNELAAKAQKYALKGEFKHNPDSTVPSGRFVTGENLFIASSTNPNLKLNMTIAVTEWFNEYKDYKYGPLSTDNFHNIGHYTQIAWANTTYVGCGVSRKLVNGWTSLLYVCNYGPAGNYIGQYPYKTGKGCEDLCGRAGVHVYADHCPTK